MGIYIEKKEILEQTKEITTQEAIMVLSSKNDEGLIPLCLVDNGGWKALAVCHSKHEWKRFNQEYDNRPKRWFVIIKELLFNEEVSGLTKNEIDLIQSYILMV